ncbi:MAG: hypothetical protein IPF57_00195 [Gammaproteobacteria bacterium]|nr:hypothetical protein [Gammaproteobacteria bacterium]
MAVVVLDRPADACLRLTGATHNAGNAEASQDERFMHGDPADRIIGATALVLNATLVTADCQLQQVAGLRCVW